MFLNNSLNDGGRNVAVPHSVRIDYHNRARRAHSQAVGFRPKNAAGPIGFWLVQPQFLQAFF